MCKCVHVCAPVCCSGQLLKNPTAPPSIPGAQEAGTAVPWSLGLAVEGAGVTPRGEPVPGLPSGASLVLPESSQSLQFSASLSPCFSSSSGECFLETKKEGGRCGEGWGTPCQLLLHPPAVIVGSPTFWSPSQSLSRLTPGKRRNRKV